MPCAITFDKYNINFGISFNCTSPAPINTLVSQSDIWVKFVFSSILFFAIAISAAPAWGEGTWLSEMILGTLKINPSSPPITRYANDHSREDPIFSFSEQQKIITKTMPISIPAQTQMQVHLYRSKFCTRKDFNEHKNIDQIRKGCFHRI
jgi:hypothetical protein